ncbi:MAG: hypothetical protein HZA50_17025 [Planctomycetes bacterium]|nr:hypothetical protein [Planctomycetota bacterium]
MGRLARIVFEVGFFIFINVGMPSCQFTNEPFSTEKLIVVDSGRLSGTIVTPHLAAPIQQDKNLIWCGTFQLVWNETAKLIDEDVHFDPESPMTAEMNKKLFSADCVDDASYVALAGFIRDGIFDRIQKSLDEKFGKKVSPRYLPDPKLTPRPQDIVAYSCLFKQLMFPAPFEKLDSPLDFAGRKVECFGMKGNKKDNQAICNQVTVLDCQILKDEFIIEIATQSQGDHLYLGKVAPGTDLLETVEAVQKRIQFTKSQWVQGKSQTMPTTLPEYSRTPQPMGKASVLKIPKMNFDVTKKYHKDELLGRGLAVKNPQVAKDLRVLDATQNIRLQLDERGMKLMSESHISFGCSAPEFADYLIFDKPFLVMLQRDGAKMAYFVMWVGNAELLTKK